MSNKEFVVRHGLVVGEDNVMTANAQTGVIVKNLSVNTAANIAMTTLRSSLRPTFFWDARYSQEVDPNFVVTSTSLRSYVNNRGGISYAQPGQIRFEYNPVTGQPLGYLSEGVETNLATRSKLDDVNWTRFANVSITANTYTAPDETTTAARLGLNTVDGTKLVWSDSTGIAYTANNFYTASVYVKETPEVPSPGYFQVRMGSVVPFGNTTVYMITELANLANIQTVGTVYRALAEPMGDGWIRLSLTANCTTTNTTTSPLLGIPFSFYANTNMEVQVWGQQLEVGDHPSSLIETIGTSASRTGESVRLSNTVNKEAFDRIFNYIDCRGTMLVEYEFPYSYANEKNDSTLFIAMRTPGLSSSSIRIHVESGELRFTLDGVVMANTPHTTGYHTAAFSFTPTSARACVDGQLLTTATPNITNFTFKAIDIGSFHAASSRRYIKRVVVYNDDLSDAELIALTKKNT